MTMKRKAARLAALVPAILVGLVGGAALAFVYWCDDWQAEAMGHD